MGVPLDGAAMGVVGEEPLPGPYRCRLPEVHQLAVPAQVDRVQVHHLLEAQGVGLRPVGCHIHPVIRAGLAVARTVISVLVMRSISSVLM